MIGKKIRSKKQDKYNLMVLNLLKELSKTPKARLSIREISRILEINPMAVSRSVEQLRHVLDIKNGSDFENFRLKVYLIKLKDELKELEIQEIVKKVVVGNLLDKEIYKR